MKLSNFIVILCIVDDVGVVAQSPEPGAHVKNARPISRITNQDINNNNIIIARHLSAHLKFSMRLQREAKTLNHLYNLR